MTTIAYKDGVIAYDSRVTAGGQISSDRCNKRRRCGGVNFFICGATCEAETFILAYFGDDADRELQMEALVYDKEILYHVSIDDESVWKDVIDLTEPCAIGSGSPYAYTAMDLGLSAKQSVMMAKKRDSGTGGRIRTYQLKGKS